MPQFINRVGQTFGKFIVLMRGPNQVSAAGNPKTVWICLCECGQIKAVTADHLVAGRTVSCGCWHREAIGIRSKTHGMSKSRTYRSWCDMIARCNNPNDSAWYRYGGRGITVCKRWLKFENFLADMGECPPGMSIDRIDNSGNYEPGNCRWATDKQQGRNKRNNRPITWRGRTQPMATWAEERGIPYQTLASRLTKLGWSIERALSTPARTWGRHLP